MNPHQVDQAAELLAALVVDHMEAAILADPEWDAGDMGSLAPYEALLALVGPDESDDYIEREQSRRGYQPRS